MADTTTVMLRALLACSISLLGPEAAAQGGAKKLLFYGNSYSSRNGSVADLVKLMAIEAGHPGPTVVKRFSGGQDLRYHETNAGQVAAIWNSLPAGQTWDFVVMQGQSTEATAAQGNPTQFRSSAVGIAGNVRGHSPAARGVMYQTWARALGHHFYPGTFATPMTMHQEIRGNYRLAVSDIESAFGPATAVNSAGGDGVALLEWDPAYYEADLFHPRPSMTLLASMCLYTSIYGERTCDIGPDFGQPGLLVNWLGLLGLGESDWHQMAGLADRSAEPALRPFPGSGDQLLMESGIAPEFVTACGRHALSAGDFVQVRIRSLNGIYDAVPAWLLFDAFPTGAPPSPPVMFPEIQLDLAGMAILQTSGQLASPMVLNQLIPFSLPGISLMLQGLAWGPSAETGNAVFATTDAHVFDFQ